MIKKKYMYFSIILYWQEWKYGVYRLVTRVNYKKGGKVWGKKVFLV